MIRNAAVEPEIYDLAKMLVEMGAEITIDKMWSWKFGKKSLSLEKQMRNVITVNGCQSLEGVTLIRSCQTELNLVPTLSLLP